MATSNKAVTTYLPPDIEKSLTEYCTNNGLTRKSKTGEIIPSFGTGIVEILKDYFQLSEDSDAGLSKGLEKYFESTLSKKVHDLVKSLVIDSKEPNLQKRITVLEDKVRDLELGKIHDSSRVALTQQFHPGQLELLSQAVSQPVAGLSIRPISGNKLSELRFGLNKSTVAGKKRANSVEKFTEWTREQDPDGIAWKFVTEPSTGYLPDGNLSSNVQSTLLSWIKDNIPESLED